MQLTTPAMTGNCDIQWDKWEEIMDQWEGLTQCGVRGGAVAE